MDGLREEGRNEEGWRGEVSGRMQMTGSLPARLVRFSFAFAVLWLFCGCVRYVVMSLSVI